MGDVNPDGQPFDHPEERPDNLVRVGTVKVASFVRVRWRTRVKLRWDRWRLERRFGKEFMEMMDECAYEAERAFILGQEHNVD